ncbi:MAG: hypothetical protein LHW60_07330 [Candidatus Cloacimonetes bacterium]|nr:hypothetical protein [Candidatus Cloacimonadota bacterium]
MSIIFFVCDISRLYLGAVSMIMKGRGVWKSYGVGCLGEESVWDFQRGCHRLGFLWGTGFVCEGEEGEVVAWGECSLIQCLGVFVPFVIDITVGLTGLNQTVSPGNPGKVIPGISS